MELGASPSMPNSDTLGSGHRARGPKGGYLAGVIADHGKDLVSVLTRVCRWTANLARGAAQPRCRTWLNQSCHLDESPTLNIVWMLDGLLSIQNGRVTDIAPLENLIPFVAGPGGNDIGDSLLQFGPPRTIVLVCELLRIKTQFVDQFGVELRLD